MSTTPTPEYTLVTPELAAQWLSMNTNNRRVRSKWVDKLAASLIDYHPAPIVRNCDGTLLDGQHRLMAIVKSGTSRWMLVINNVPAEMQNMIDTGKARSGGDVLALNGHRNSNHLAAAARFCMNWELDPELRNESSEVLPSEILSYVERYPELAEHVSAATNLVARSAPRLKQPPVSKFAVARMVIARAFGDAYSDAYCRSLILGVDISEDSVIFVARQRLMAIATGKDAAIGLSGYKNARMTFWIVLRAAVAHRNGEALKKILYRSDKSPMPISLDGVITSENNAIDSAG